MPAKATKKKINPDMVRKKGTRQTFLKLPGVKPEFPGNFRLIAIVGTGVSSTATDVTEQAAYAEMYGEATKPGCPYAVELYSLHVDYL
jgi:hypothetical protein